MPQVSVTRLRLRSIRFLPAFLWRTVQSLQQARTTDGCLGAAIRRHGGAFWTLTVWRDRNVLRAFMLHGAHKKAMGKLAHWCDEASLAHWEQDGVVLPGWKEAAQRLGTIGRTSPVRYPSPAQVASYPLGSEK